MTALEIKMLLRSSFPLTQYDEQDNVASSQFRLTADVMIDYTYAFGLVSYQIEQNLPAVGEFDTRKACTAVAWFERVREGNRRVRERLKPFPGRVCLWNPLN